MGGTKPSSARGTRSLAPFGAKSEELGAQCCLCSNDFGYARDPDERRRGSVDGMLSWVVSKCVTSFPPGIMLTPSSDIFWDALRLR